MTNSNKKSVYSWAFYDWANSAYATTVMAGFFPIFFKEYFSVGADVTVSTARLGFANSFASLVIVFLAPLFGAIADAGGLKKRFLFIFAYIGILTSFCLCLVGKGDWEVAVFVYIIGNVGFMGSNIFYDSLLPSVAKKRSVDLVSGMGFALGYLGGGILFALLISLVQGGIQALSRSYYSKMIPAEFSAEFFGFYNFLGKFAAILGPFLVGTVALLSGSSRAGIASVAVFFILGAFLLTKVDAEKAAKEARELL